jgi:predicted RNA binding protein YcfA (HicA-like mRNA interferase family)
MKHPVKGGQVVLAHHGSQDLGKGLEAKLRKASGLKKK